MKICDNAIVTLDYVLMDESGEILESSSEDGEYEYLHGSGDMLPGVEKILEGMEKGQKTEIVLTPEEGFGAREDELVYEVEKGAFPPDLTLEEGMEFDVEDEHGLGIITVLELRGDKVLIDRNHPLAGQTLKVAAEVLDVREAEPWEIEHWGHDHAHDHGDCDCGDDCDCDHDHGDGGCGCGHHH